MLLVKEKSRYFKFKKLSSYSICAFVITALAACSTPFIKQPIKPLPNELIKSSSALKAREGLDGGSIAIANNSPLAQVVGRIYLRNQNDSSERTGKYVEVALNPVSNASNQWYRDVCLGGFELAGDIGPSYRNMIRTSVSNEMGQFAFPNVPEGEYYLSARLYWFDEKPMSGPEMYGGLLAKKIRVGQLAISEQLTQENACSGNYREYRLINIFN